MGHFLVVSTMEFRCSNFSGKIQLLTYNLIQIQMKEFFADSQLSFWMV